MIARNSYFCFQSHKKIKAYLQWWSSLWWLVTKTISAFKVFGFRIIDEDGDQIRETWNFLGDSNTRRVSLDLDTAVVTVRRYKLNHKILIQSKVHRTYSSRKSPLDLLNPSLNIVHFDRLKLRIRDSDKQVSGMIKEMSHFVKLQHPLTPIPSLEIEFTA